MDYKQQISTLTEAVIAQGGSDLHLIDGNRPVIRVSGELVTLLSEPPLSDADMQGIIEVILSAEQKKRFSETKEIDFSWSYGNKTRFRGNGYLERGGLAIALRLIPQQIKTIAELNLPPILETFAAKEQGFFLVVGPV